MRKNGLISDCAKRIINVSLPVFFKAIFIWVINLSVLKIFKIQINDINDMITL